MDLFQQQALALIKCALTGESCSFEEKPDAAAMVKLAAKHKIAALMYIVIRQRCNNFFNVHRKSNYVKY